MARSADKMTFKRVESKRELANFAPHLVGHLALEVHCELNHVVVGFPSKEDFSCVQLIESASH